MIGEIVKFDNLGRGILYDNDKITFISKCVPGDVIEYDIVKSTKSYNIGKLIRVIIPSKNRITPKCPFFDNCGGCELQHISYKDTIEYKESNIRYLLNKHNINCELSIIKNPQPFNYRNKVTLKIVDGKIGFYESKSNTIVSINECLLASKSINDVISNIDKLNIKNGIVTIRSNELNEILLVINTLGIVNLNNLNTNIIGVVINDKLCYGVDTINEVINGITYQTSYNSFFQVNPYITSLLFNIIKDNIYSDNILDLYCGVGAITLQVASKCKKVTGVEIVDNAIKNAKHNAKINNINNVDFILSDSTKAVKELENNYNTIIVDPPRSGLTKEVCNYLSNSNAKRIIYVSCNPQTLFRDLDLLKEKYEVNKYYLCDMFSYTAHVECVCILDKY